MASIDSIDLEYSTAVVEVERGRKRKRDASKWKKNLTKSVKYRKSDKEPCCDCLHSKLVQYDGRGRRPKQCRLLFNAGIYKYC